jgi:hypothetical protein
LHIHRAFNSGDLRLQKRSLKLCQKSSYRGQHEAGVVANGVGDEEEAAVPLAGLQGEVKCRMLVEKVWRPSQDVAEEEAAAVEAVLEVLEVHHPPRSHL